MKLSASAVKDGSQEDDDVVVVVCSDGIVGNLSTKDMRNIIEAGMHSSLGPHGLARELVQFAVGTNRKPDETHLWVS